MSAAASVFRASTPEDLPRITALLEDVFGSSPSFAPEVMRWKYWQPRGDWSGPRSYIYEKAGGVVAHGGIWPVRFPYRERPNEGVHVIDWAGARGSPGTGIALMLKLSQIYDFIYAIGGSDDTRRVLPGIGFVEIAQAWTAARPLRPVRQILADARLNWKLPARFARNWLWSLSGGRSVSPEWSASETSPARLTLDFATARDFLAAPPFLAAPHGAPFFEYLLGCPVARFRLYELSRNSAVLGHFVLGSVRGQIRVGGVWLRDPDPDAFQAAFTVAGRIARECPGACELTVTGSAGPSESAAVLAGLRLRRHAPVYLLSKKTAFRFPAGYQFQMVDDDEAFLDPGRPCYLT